MSWRLSRTVLRRGKGSNPFSLVDYTSNIYKDLLDTKGAIRSMSRPGNCWDNAVIENFFGHFKAECVKLRKKTFNTFSNVFNVVTDYINFYNNDRIQLSLKTSSIKYKTQLQVF